MLVNMNTPVNGPHTRDNNELTLFKLGSPRKRLDGKTATHSIQYIWRNVDGGVQGCDFTLFTAAEAKPMLTAASLFDHIDLF